MKLIRLDLRAFGPFSERSLDFASQKPGLHIVFGPNEAGKSSSLRALKALLYGFDERTSDNFQYASDQLLVAGALQGSDGQELVFSRRKKRKADLLDSEGNPMDPGRLAAFLHGIELDLFKSLYGIDHQILVQGGEDILAQKGEMGQALFAAGAGISSLKKILEALDAEADELFKSRGTKQQINQAISAYKDLKKTLREASLLPGKWKEHKKRLKDVEAERDRLEEEKGEKSAEVRRLARLQRAIPELAKLDNLDQQLRKLGEVVVLPPEFSENLRQLKQEIREAELQLNSSGARLQKLQEKQKGISLNQPLLDHAEAIEDLHQRIGGYRKGTQDREKLEGMRIAHRKEAGTLIEGIRPELTLQDADGLRPVLARKRTIQALSSQYEALTQQQQQVRKQKEKARKNLEEINNSLSGQSPSQNGGELQKVMKPARNAGDLDGLIDQLSREIESAKEACRLDLKRLGLWSGEIDQLMELSLPLPETVRRYEADFSELDNDEKQLRKDRKSVEVDLKEADRQIREIAYGGEVPSEDDLTASRDKRQDGWNLLRRQWLAGEDVSREAEEYDPGRSVVEAYEKYVAEADHIADRLRREAGRVSKAADLRARIETLEEIIREIAQHRQNLQKSKERLVDEWQAEWKSARIKPLSPKEMLNWISEIDSLRHRVTEIFNKEAALNEKDTVRKKLINALVEELEKLGESVEHTGRDLAPVLVFADSVAEKISSHKSGLEKLQDKEAQFKTALDHALNELAEAEAARAAWKGKWDKALSGLGLAEEILPGDALDLLEKLDACFDKLEKAKEFQSRIKGIDHDVKKFGDDVRALLEKTAPELRDLSPDQAALQLHTMLGNTRHGKDLLEKNSEEIETLTAEIGTAEKSRQSFAEQMAELLETAKCAKEADLTEAIWKSSEYQRLTEKVSEVEAYLAEISEGIPPEVIKGQAMAVVVDELPGQVASLQRRIDEDLYPGIKEVSQRIGEEKRELQHMDGGGKAAEAAEEMEQVAARIRGLVDHYTRIKLAAKVLHSEIERYREAHQDPILKVASRIFSELTIASFAGLRADVDDNGKAILIGMRPDDSRVPVEGMSDGTRDQLYLALRLATLEWRLEYSEAMPFIVDDILINFDDERSRATLQALADLSEKNQVILFTHHQQIVETAMKLDGGEVLVHEL